MDWNSFFSFLQDYGDSLNGKSNYEIFNLYISLHWMPNLSKAEVKKIMDSIENFKRTKKELLHLLEGGK